ncbi:MAG: hypothetical protein ISR70_03750 [Candidatus Thioglobus sp.]|nr:hypothetical protein [Candidatus Thioglobus pontius]MBL6977157.1 hypothetical protein [Candidatus Thioglobus sp.]MBL6985004.1 hypothetical protein [Candidatus Thioglobus sp.]
MHGAVYIFENIKAQRIKIGMTINSTSKIKDRLKDVNNIWTGYKGMCQICGTRRFINEKELMPKHMVNGKNCTGENSLPIERDTTLSESHLAEIKEFYCSLSGSEKGSLTRIINNLENRIKKYRKKIIPIGTWTLSVVYYTDCAEEVELLSHKLLNKRLDRGAPLGEIFNCSVSTASLTVETVLKQQGLLDMASKKIYS